MIFTLALSGAVRLKSQVNAIAAEEKLIKMFPTAIVLKEISRFFLCLRESRRIFSKVIYIER